MTQQLETVIYNNPVTDQEYYVHCLKLSNINLYAASKVLELLEVSYEHQFENPAFQASDGVLPVGTMKGRFSRVQDDNLKQMNRMNRSISHGSTYWYVNPEETSPTERTFRDNASGYVAGIIKTSPSRTTRPQRLHLRAPDCYVNDIVVDPKHKRRVDAKSNHRLGSMLMHAALKFGDLKPPAKLVIDGYVGNDIANAWFERLGLKVDPLAELAGWAASDKIILDQVRFTSQAGKTIRRHVQALEQSTPWLARASHIVNA